MSTVVQMAPAVEFGEERRFSIPGLMPPTFESLLENQFADNIAFSYDRRSSTVSLSKFAAGAEELDAMFDSMFAGPSADGSPEPASGTEFDSEVADLESLVSDSFASEVAERVVEKMTPQAFAPQNNFPSMVIPATNGPLSISIPAMSSAPMAMPMSLTSSLPPAFVPASSISPISTVAPASTVSSLPSPAAARKPRAKRPRSSSTPQNVPPALVAARPIARGSSLGIKPTAPVVPTHVAEQPIQPRDYLDLLTTSTLGPDPALLEDASLDAIDDAMCEAEELANADDPDKKGKKRRRRTTAELSTTELETRRLKNSEAARRCRLRKTLRVKWLEARVKELEEMNAALVAKLREH